MAYNHYMAQGRPASKPRTELGIQIVLARKEKGLTQQDLADKLKVSQRVITYWERRPVALKPEQLSALADALEVSTDFLLGREVTPKKTSPKGKAQLVFDQISKLPRGKQKVIFEMLEGFLEKTAS